jgi:hypothetical protein
MALLVRGDEEGSCAERLVVVLNLRFSLQERVEMLTVVWHSIQHSSAHVVFVISSFAAGKPSVGRYTTW